MSHMQNSRLNPSRLELGGSTKQRHKPYTQKNGLLAVSDHKNSPVSRSSSDSLEDTVENINLDLVRADTPC